MPPAAAAAFPAVDWSPWVSQAATAGLLTDYDGTIAPIVADRELAVPYPGAIEVLSGLASKLGVVGIVSGRPLSFLLFQLGGVPGLALFGTYGLERCQVGARVDRPGREVNPLALAWETVVSRAASEAEEQAPPGVEVERKGLSFTLHARRRPEMVGWARDWATQVAASTGLRAEEGRMSVELLPPVPAGKGRVVEELATALDALCFAGDDRADLPAFEALNELRARGKTTLSVGVASSEQPPELPESVDVLVEGPAGTVALLTALADALGT